MCMLWINETSMTREENSLRTARQSEKTEMGLRVSIHMEMPR